MSTSPIRSKQPISTQPKMYYKLTPLSGEQALDEITHHTNNFADQFKIDNDFAAELTLNLGMTDEVYHGFLFAPKNNDITKQVIGKDGCYFHRATSECKIDFIWHNRQQNRFEFWGQKAPLIKAMNAIKWRIDTVTQRMINQ